MYTTRSQLSSRSLNHHLYMLTTQLFFFFYPQDRDLSITRLQNALREIYSWMPPNLLTVNPSTEFFLVAHRHCFNFNFNY